MSTSIHTRSSSLERSLGELKETIEQQRFVAPQELERVKLDLELLKCQIFMEIVYQLEEIDDSLLKAPLLAVKKEDIESAAATLGATLGDALSGQ